MFSNSLPTNSRQLKGNCSHLDQLGDFLEPLAESDGLVLNVTQLEGDVYFSR